MKVNSPILPILTLKLVATATSLNLSEKEGQIGNLRSNNFGLVRREFKRVVDL